MVKEEIVSFETAKLAKEKGFSGWWCRNCYDDKGMLEGTDLIDGCWFTDEDIENAEENGFKLYLAPTQSLLQRWIKERYNILLTILPWKDHNDNVNYPYTFRPMIVGVKIWETYDTYEEALEKGLYEVLKLI